MEFRRLHGLGSTFRQIAAVLNISERTVTAWREELNLPRRPRGRKQEGRNRNEEEIAFLRGNLRRDSKKRL